MSNKKRFLTGLIVGGAAGVLFAPKKGAETRAELAKNIKVLLDSLKEEMTKIDDFDEIDFNLEDKIIEIKNDLTELDKIKIKRIAVKQAEKIKEKSESIYQTVRTKGTPIMEKIANNIRLKSAELLYNLADNLEKTNKKK